MQTMQSCCCPKNPPAGKRSAPQRGTADRSRPFTGSAAALRGDAVFSPGFAGKDSMHVDCFRETRRFGQHREEKRHGKGRKRACEAQGSGAMLTVFEKGSETDNMALNVQDFSQRNRP